MSHPNETHTTFATLTRGIPAYKVAQAMNSLQSELDFSRCPKKHLAEAWAARGSNSAYRPLSRFTDDDLKVALARALDGKYVTPTQRIHEVLELAVRNYSERKRGKS